MSKLEKEFEKIKNYHKHRIIAATLMLNERFGIYNSPLLRDKYGDGRMTIEGEDRAFEVADELYRNRKENPKEFNAVYEMCWRTMKHDVVDDKAYNF